jgi:GNAT superfamily N-acetyltransferase
MPGSGPLLPATSDVSVRPAVPGDERAIAAVQLAAWRTTHGEALGDEVLDRIDPARLTEQWATAITSPPGRGYRVLVAVHGPRLVGFASVVPVTAPPGSGDDTPGGEILALEVEPGERRLGHGSRLLAAVVDLLRDEDRATSVQTWVVEGDAAREQFLGSAGLGDVGARRVLGEEDDPREITEHLWGASI